MQFTVSIIGDKQMIAKFETMSQAVQAALYRKVTSLVLRLEALVKQKLSGEVLNVGKNRFGHTGGQLRSSIDHKVEQSTESITGIVFSSGDVRYAAIHEFGGTTSPHVIVPKRAAVLAYVSGGDKQFAMRVQHPGSRFPERSYTRSSLRDMSEAISMGLKEAVVMGAKQHLAGGAT